MGALACMATHNNYESQVGIILRLVTTNHISIIGIFVAAKAKYFLILHFKDSFTISCLHLPFLIVHFFLKDWGAW